MVFAWIPFIVRAVQIYAVTMYPQAGQILPIDASLFRDFIEQQGVFVFFVSVYVGAGLIANDRRANALQIYLSKPLHARRVHRRQAGRAPVLPGDDHVAAGAAARHRAGRVRWRDSA